MPRTYSRRARGEGSVYLTKDGRWRAAVVVTHLDGRQKRRVVSGRSRSEVVRKLDDLKKQATAGYAAGETVGTYLARWLEARQREVRFATLREYRRHADRWTQAIGTVPLTKLSPAHVERVMADLSPSTARAMRTALRKALHDARRERLIFDNAASLARPPRVARRELRPLTVAEVNRLLAATEDEPIYAVAVTTGLRLAELLGLRWDDIDSTRYDPGRGFVGTSKLIVRRTLHNENGAVVFEEPKTPRSRRTVMLPVVASLALWRQKQAQEAAKAAAGSAWQDTTGLVFTDAVGRPLSPWSVSARFRQWARSEGLPVRLHDLRHTAASVMLGAGVSLKVVSETLGHSSIAITADVYAHVTPELRREAAEAMDRALG